MDQNFLQTSSLKFLYQLSQPLGNKDPFFMFNFFVSFFGIFFSPILNFKTSQNWIFYPQILIKDKPRCLRGLFNSRIAILSLVIFIKNKLFPLKILTFMYIS